MPPHPLTNFQWQKYYQNEPKFKGIYSRNNLSEIKDGPNVINLDEFKSIGTHCVALYVDDNNIIYPDSFEVEHIPKEIKKIHRKQKCPKKYLYNTSIGFDNV